MNTEHNLNTFLSKSLSQARQDIYALYINDFSPNGYFVDLGSNEPFRGNNSALLENIGWNGFMVDYNQGLVDQCNLYRKNPAVWEDLTKTSLTDLFERFKTPEIIDYLSMDLDNNAAFPSIQSFDFTKYKIKAMTFEHDSYLNGDEMRNASRDFLQGKGLKIICSDVSIFGGKSFEDWYVNPDLVSSDIWEKIVCDKTEFTDIFNKVIL
jgi:hypothetical protein